MVWWALGHSSQQINVSAHVSIWYLIAAVVLGAKPLSEKVSRGAFLLYILFLQLASAHHLPVRPGHERRVEGAEHLVLHVLRGDGLDDPRLHGSGLRRSRPASQGLHQRPVRVAAQGALGQPGVLGMFISLVSFGFLGGISGVVLGTEQINMLMHNTFYVPGHFHTTVVTGTTLAFMAVTYILVPVLFRREMILPKLCQIQPYLFGISMSITGLVMMGAGTLGVFRRHWDMAFSGAPFQYEWPGAAYLMMGLTGIFGTLTIIGGAVDRSCRRFAAVRQKLEGGTVSDKPTPIPDNTQAAAARTLAATTSAFRAPSFWRSRCWSPSSSTTS